MFLFFQKKLCFFCCSCSIIGFLVFRFIIIISSLLFPLICILSSSFFSPRFSCCLRVGGFCFGFAAVRKKCFVVVDIALIFSVAMEELTLELLLEYLSRFKRHIYQRPEEKPPGGIRFLLMI